MRVPFQVEVNGIITRRIAYGTRDRQQRFECLLSRTDVKMTCCLSSSTFLVKETPRGFGRDVETRFIVLVEDDDVCA